MKSDFFATVEIYTHIQLTLKRLGGEFDQLPSFLLFYGFFKNVCFRGRVDFSFLVTVKLL